MTKIKFELVEKNIVDSRGKGRNTHYVLKRVGDSGNYLAFFGQIRC